MLAYSTSSDSSVSLVGLHECLTWYALYAYRVAPGRSLESLEVWTHSTIILHSSKHDRSHCKIGPRIRTLRLLNLPHCLMPIAEHSNNKSSWLSPTLQSYHENINRNVFTLWLRVIHAFRKLIEMSSLCDYAQYMHLNIIAVFMLHQESSFKRPQRNHFSSRQVDASGEQASQMPVCVVCLVRRCARARMLDVSWMGATCVKDGGLCTACIVTGASWACFRLAKSPSFFKI